MRLSLSLNQDANLDRHIQWIYMIYDLCIDYLRLMSNSYLIDTQFKSNPRPLYD